MAFRRRVFGALRARASVSVELPLGPRGGGRPPVRASLFARVAEGFSPHFTGKAFFTTAFLFAGSLWFYFVRFFRLNPHASLLAPFAAHLAKNLAVFAVKLAQGQVVSFF